MNRSSLNALIALLVVCPMLAVDVNAADSPSSAMGSTVFDWSAIEVIQTRNGARRDFFDAAPKTLDRLECHVTTVNVGEASHAPHRHPDEEMIIVKEGTLEVTINGATSLAPAGSIIFYASNDLHGMRNAGDVPATYYVLRWTSPGHEGPKPPQH